jgi:hypothetical protein
VNHHETCSQIIDGLYGNNENEQNEMKDEIKHEMKDEINENNVLFLPFNNEERLKICSFQPPTDRKRKKC